MGFISHDCWQIAYIMPLKMQTNDLAAFQASWAQANSSPGITILLAHDAFDKPSLYRFQTHIVACMGSVSPPNGQYSLRAQYINIYKS